MYVVTVQFAIRPEELDAFMSAMREQARVSIENEPGCVHFDVCISESDQTSIFLYEIYESRAAFDLHLKSEHFSAFDAKVAPLIADKTVQTWTLEPK